VSRLKVAIQRTDVAIRINRSRFQLVDRRIGPLSSPGK